MTSKNIPEEKKGNAKEQKSRETTAKSVNPVRSSHGALNPVFAKIDGHSSPDSIGGILLLTG